MTKPPPTEGNLQMTTKLNLMLVSLMLLAGAAYAAEATGAPPATASVDVTDLRCEYLKDPLGINVQQPRLSWRLTAKDAAARGLRQTAYRIFVSRSLERLAKDEGDRWDSGEVASGESVHIAYAGVSRRHERELRRLRGNRRAGQTRQTDRLSVLRARRQGHDQPVAQRVHSRTFRQRHVPQPLQLSLLHSSYLHLGLWFVEGLGGIQPDPKQGGFQSFVIRPGIPKTRKADLEWVWASYESLTGRSRAGGRSRRRSCKCRSRCRRTPPPRSCCRQRTPPQSASPAARSRNRRG